MKISNILLLIALMSCILSSQAQTVNGRWNGHDFVDMGLSVMWATANLGATNPEDYGNFFAWGKTDYPANLNFSKSDPCTASSSIAGVSSYDAATELWSGGWRVPTRSQFEELIDNCEVSVGTVSGKKVFFLKSKINGNSLCLPASGGRGGTSTSYRNVDGYYWSSDPSTSNKAYCLVADGASKTIFIGDNDRYLGQSIRPVAKIDEIITQTAGDNMLPLSECAGTIVIECAVDAKGKVMSARYRAKGSSGKVAQDTKLRKACEQEAAKFQFNKPQNGYKATGLLIFKWIAPNYVTKTFTVNGVSFKMVQVVGGTFMMGSNDLEIAQPVHKVTLSDYMIGETEVTQALWIAVMGKKYFNKSGDQFPAYGINWIECADFISELNKLTGLNFRFPTEAEWEFAARGGVRSKGWAYSGGFLCNDWWPHEVRGNHPNELGLYDMSGNVCEWCQDYIVGSSYLPDSELNPKGPLSGEYKVFRGGAYNNSAERCTVYYRNGERPGDFSNIPIGLRLAL